jgi:hypothetical protein
MPGLLNSSSVLMCPHGGVVQATTSNTRTKAAGDFVLRSSDTFVISGCPFILGLIPHPCVQVQWIVPAELSQVVGDFTLTEASVGLCIAPDMTPQGAVLVAFTQPNVSGT